MIQPAAHEPAKELIGAIHCTHAIPMLGFSDAYREAERPSQPTEVLAAIPIPVACVGRYHDAVTGSCVVSLQGLHDRLSKLERALMTHERCYSAAAGSTIVKENGTKQSGATINEFRCALRTVRVEIDGLASQHRRLCQDAGRLEQGLNLQGSQIHHCLATMYAAVCGLIELAQADAAYLQSGPPHEAFEECLGLSDQAEK
ncbi:hypothetical protein LTR49_028062 [Elasticomyces elasticus]|nr:hypothetical protein LTR49_028062 [Elasticomyces elasticus]